MSNCLLNHRFERGRPLRVCGNIASMLADSRYVRHFGVDEDTATHYGLFDCAPQPASVVAGAAGACP